MLKRLKIRHIPVNLLAKYLADADVNPMAVVKQASDTIIQRTSFPGYPSNEFVITTIKDYCGVSTP